jgi:hypothetical protein
VTEQEQSEGLPTAAIQHGNRIATVYDGESMPWADEIVWREKAHRAVVDEMLRYVSHLDKEEFDYDELVTRQDVEQLIKERMENHQGDYEVKAAEMKAEERYAELAELLEEVQNQ